MASTLKKAVVAVIDDELTDDEFKSKMINKNLDDAQARNSKKAKSPRILISRRSQLKKCQS